MSLVVFADIAPVLKIRYLPADVDKTNCLSESIYRIAATGDLSDYAFISFLRFVFVSYAEMSTFATLPFSKKNII